ncbi:MAG: hypothetical protein LBJ73_04085 [Rickettsiales bacterium]|jgi:hypothetical protein|nr:hypothetical protein [Rickettsiales bacterium]
MKDTLQKLNPSDISSDVYVIAPTQIEYIAQVFGDAVADAMNMRTFSAKIRQVAEHSLRHALGAAKNQATNK